MIYNEDTNVKVPKVLYLIQMGFISLREANWDIETKIFTEITTSHLANINDGSKEDDLRKSLNILENQLPRIHVVWDRCF